MPSIASRRLVASFALFAAVSIAGSAVRAQGRPHPARDLVLETIPWISDGAEFLDQKRFKTSMTPQEEALDREKLLDVALAQARTSGRPVLVYVYKICERTKRGRQMIRAPVLDVYMRQVVWSDPDVERIVTNSFVPVRTVFDDALCKRFDLQPLTFLEPAILCLAPDGQVLHVLQTIRTFDAGWVAGVLRDVLVKAHGALTDGGLDAALARGDWQRALSVVEGREGEAPRDLYLRATMLRRLRRGEDALAQLEAAERLLQEAAKRLVVADERPVRSRRARRPRLPQPLRQLALQIEAERGLVLVRMGRFDEALGALRKVADAPADAWLSGGSRRAEAGYLLAQVRLQAGDEAGALRRFRQIVQQDPDDLWARRADVNLRVGIDDGLSLGAPMFGYQTLSWLPEGAYAQLPEDTRWSGTPLADSELIDHCVRSVLAQQRADGGWNDSRYAYCPDARITPNVWVAITAVCCQALLRSRHAFADKEQIDVALRRGEDYLLDPSRLNRGRNEDVYADTYRLLFLAHRWRSEPDDARRDRLRAAMSRIVGEARERQKQGGFWAHEYSNAFCTASMVQGLLAARNVGVDVPEAMLASARLALASARREDGSFSYGGAARRKPRQGAVKNASTRMPMCEGAMYALGGSDEQRLGFAFDSFWQHYAAIEGVRRTDFHSDGQIAGFMFLNSLYHTSEAIAWLPPERALLERRSLRQKLRSYPEIDGTFVDSEELGRSYGAAMALLILANTDERDRDGR